jgi:DNA-binding GntR family transcriptional regulator
MIENSDKKSLLMEQVYKQIKEKIIYGQLKAGQLLTVGEISDYYQVSKTPVRDAFNALKHDGLLDVLPYKGYIVSSIDARDLKDLFSLRVLLEGGAAELAALNATKDIIVKLEELAKVDLDSEEDSKILFMKANFNFHTMVAKASENQRLTKAITSILDNMQRVLYLDLKIMDPHDMQSEHMELVDLIRKRDSHGAKQLMIKHIESSSDRIFTKTL